MWSVGRAGEDGRRAVASASREAVGVDRGDEWTARGPGDFGRDVLGDGTAVEMAHGFVLDGLSSGGQRLVEWDDVDGVELAIGRAPRESYKEYEDERDARPLLSKHNTPASKRSREEQHRRAKGREKSSR